MKKLLKLSLALVVIIIGGLIIVPFLIPLETYKQEATAKLSEMTGRDISINGEMSFQLLPNVAVVLGDVTIGNPTNNSYGFTSPYLAKAQKVNVGVALSPLLSKELVVQQFELEQPDIYLEVAKGGKQNWDIEFHTPSLPSAELISSAYAADGQGGKSFTLSKVELSKLAISAGKLTYMDGATKHMLTDISLASDSVKLNQPTEIAGGLTWNGEAFEIKSRIDSIEQLSANKPTDAVVSVDSDQLKLSFNGKLSQAGIRGGLDIGSPSLVTLMAWLGQPLDWKNTPLLLAVKGQANCNAARCELTEANFAIDNIRLKGNVTANYEGKPSISGNLSSERIELAPYMSTAAQTYPQWGMISSAYAAAPWGTDAIDLSGLAAFNVDLMLTIGQLVLPDVTIKNIKAQPQVQNGSASINLMQSELFGGTLSGTVTALPRGNYINATTKLNAANIDMEQLLVATSGEAGMSGKTTLSTSLTARGNTPASLIQTLGGSGNLAIRDGAIKGVNIGQMARNVKSAFLNSNSSGAQSTDFAEVTASYTIANGVLSNKDLAMKAPLLRVKGEGSVNLPAYTINYRLMPEIVETSKGQGGKDKTGIQVPVLVTGSLDNPQFAPDLEYLLNKENLDANIDAVTDSFKEKKAEFKELKTEKKQLFKDLKKDLKEDPSQLLKDPNKINEQLNNLLQGF